MGFEMTVSGRHLWLQLKSVDADELINKIRGGILNSVSAVSLSVPAA